MLTDKEREAAANYAKPLIDGTLEWQQLRLTVRDIKVTVHIHQEKVHSLEVRPSGSSAT